MWPSVSPDGTALAYVESRGAESEADAVGVIALDSGRRIARLETPRGATFNNGVYWSPDGAAIVYRDFSDGLWRQSLDGAPAVKMPGLPDKKIYFAGWSADRRLFAMSYGDEVRDVVLMRGFR
jgi:hypothetical protein